MDCLNANGLCLVLALNNLLNDCEYSKPNSYAISLIERWVMDNFSLSFFNEFFVDVLLGRQAGRLLKEITQVFAR